MIYEKYNFELMMILVLIYTQIQKYNIICKYEIDSNHSSNNNNNKLSFDL